MRNPLKIVVYQDARNEFRWRMSRSGRIVADSGEGYKRASGALRAAKALVTAIQKGECVHAQR